MDDRIYWEFKYSNYIEFVLSALSIKLVGYVLSRQDLVAA